MSALFKKYSAIRLVDSIDRQIAAENDLLEKRAKDTLVEKLFRAVKGLCGHSSQPASSEFSKRRQDILSAVSLLTTANPAATIFLADVEFQALAKKNYLQFDPIYLTSAEQKKRGNANRCLVECPEIPEAPAMPVWNVQKLNNIFALMRKDTTASWLLDFVENKNVPYILMRYDIGENLLPATYNVGKYTMYRNRKGFIIEWEVEAIKLYITPSSTDRDIALTAAHESRHCWQEHVVSSANSSSSPLDQIIAKTLEEADARAVEAKVNWRLSSTLPKSDYSPEAARFEYHHNKPSFRTLSPAERLKKCMQEEFLFWLRREINSPSYIDKFISQFPEMRASTSLPRQIEDSQYLGIEFLSRLSKVSKNASYIDTDGQQAIKSAIRASFPIIITSYKANTKTDKHNLD